MPKQLVDSLREKLDSFREKLPEFLFNAKSGEAFIPGYIGPRAAPIDAPLVLLAIGDTMKVSWVERSHLIIAEQEMGQDALVVFVRCKLISSVDGMTRVQYRGRDSVEIGAHDIFLDVPDSAILFPLRLR